MADEYCQHDRVAKDCPYCRIKRRERLLFSDAASSALPDVDEEHEDEQAFITKKTQGGRASLDEWEADDCADDGLEDLYRRGVRHNPRETGMQDTLSDNDQDILGNV
jgi:hypothetical protein